jgi:serine/threonine-protein kinase
MADPSSQERWQRVSELLDGALDLPLPLRPTYLEAACAGDAGLRREVEALLASCERGAGFLDTPAPEFAARLLAASGEPPVQELAEGARIGPYRVVRELGRGGMGAVYLAERDDPHLRQRVAIKLVRGGLGSGYLVHRFMEERQILASLSHPGIARLLDGAVTPEGVPWFAMEYVEGVPLDRYCDERRLTVPERLALFCQVCDAVRYAHRNLVVHRDLKPGNILVTADGSPKLLDFGIARLLSAEAAGEAGGVQMMTPQYASPEQRLGAPATTAADVYALGVLLHRLLTGRHPPSPGAGPAAAPGPGAAAPAADAAAGARKPDRFLRGDLDAIVRRAMHPEPECRYEGAEQLAADVRRHMRLLPVHARPRTRGYRTRRFVQRNRWGVGVTAAVMALVMAFAVLSGAQARRIAVERDRARQVEGFLLGLFYGANVQAGSGRAVTVRELLDRGAAQIARGEVRQPETRARLFFALGKAYHAQGDYGRAIALLDSSYALERGLRGPGHPTAIAVANNLADVLRVAGRYDDARALYAVVLASRRREFGGRSTEVARSLNGLAMVLRMQGRYGEAEAMLREALSIDRERAALEPAALTQTLNNLGHVLRERGDLAGAEALHRESLAARRALWGPEHFEVSVSLANLAAVLRDRRDYVGADTLYRQVLQLRARLAGEDHPDLAVDRAGYALLLHRRGDTAGAVALYRRALEVHRRALPAGHPVTASTLVGLGDGLVALGRAHEAEPLLREALASRAAVLPSGHWQIAEAQSALGACLSALGRPGEAEPLLEGALPVLSRRAGPADPHTAEAVRRLNTHRTRIRHATAGE